MLAGWQHIDRNQLINPLPIFDSFDPRLHLRTIGIQRIGRSGVILDYDVGRRKVSYDYPQARISILRCWRNLDEKNRNNSAHSVRKVPAIYMLTPLVSAYEIAGFYRHFPKKP